MKIGNKCLGFITLAFLTTLYLLKCTCILQEPGVKFARYTNFEFGTDLELEFHADNTWTMYVLGVKKYSGSYRLDKSGKEIFLGNFPDFFSSDLDLVASSTSEIKRLGISRNRLDFVGIVFQIKECGKVLDIGDGMPESFVLKD
jgi:hypothetical protein